MRSLKLVDFLYLNALVDFVSALPSLTSLTVDLERARADRGIGDTAKWRYLSEFASFVEKGHLQQLSVLRFGGDFRVSAYDKAEFAGAFKRIVAALPALRCFDVADDEVFGVVQSWFAKQGRRLARAGDRDAEFDERITIAAMTNE